MKKFPAVLLPLPLGEVSPQVTERAHAGGNSHSPQTKRAAPENGAALLAYDEKKKMKKMAYYLAAFSPSGKMILFTKKKITMEMPPLSTVVPML